MKGSRSDVKLHNQSIIVALICLVLCLKNIILLKMCVYRVVLLNSGVFKVCFDLCIWILVFKWSVACVIILLFLCINMCVSIHAHKHYTHMHTVMLAHARTHTHKHTHTHTHTNTHIYTHTHTQTHTHTHKHTRTHTHTYAHTHTFQLFNSVYLITPSMCFCVYFNGVENAPIELFANRLYFMFVCSGSSCCSGQVCAFLNTVPWGRWCC